MHHFKSSSNTDPNTHITSFTSAVVDDKMIPDSASRMRVKNLKSKTLRPNSKVIVRLAQSHSLRIMDNFLARTKICGFVPYSELMKNARIVSSNVALVAPSKIEAEGILAASRPLQLLISTVLIEK
ncbi:hypothetical protein EPUL_005554 [Erysiphe pulchra]|uniref:Uncharacterized protein n=1 Tax=Erysiphe pulchra TaxID=225359 RepID=A0A2S4PN93_9PEZI|nr:hypothetical protein EPUL_005554 [Erysiphe pulchra]